MVTNLIKNTYNEKTSAKPLCFILLYSKQDDECIGGSRHRLLSLAIVYLYNGFMC